MQKAKLIWWVILPLFLSVLSCTEKEDIINDGEVGETEDVISIAVKSTSDETDYFINEPLDLTGLSLTITTNEVEETVEFDAFESKNVTTSPLNGSILDIEGNVEIEIVYRDADQNELGKTSFQVSVTEEVFDPIKDVEGNEHLLKRFGRQIWMVENLKSSKFNSGDLKGQSIGDSFSLNEVSDSNTDEFLFMSYKPTQNNQYFISDFCPEGFHLPQILEWMELINYLSESGYNWDGTTEALDYSDINASQSAYPFSNMNYKNKVNASLVIGSEWAENHNSKEMGSPSTPIEDRDPSYQNGGSGFNVIHSETSGVIYYNTPVGSLTVHSDYASFAGGNGSGSVDKPNRNYFSYVRCVQNEDKDEVKVEISKLPNNQKQYTVINYSGIEVTRTFRDGSTEVIPYEDFADKQIFVYPEEGKSLTQEGDYPIKVHGISDWSEEVNINVEKGEISAVAVEGKEVPNKLEYYVGETIDFTGMEFELTVNGETTVIKGEDIPSSAYGKGKVMITASPAHGAVLSKYDTKIRMYVKFENTTLEWLDDIPLTILQ
ncbi:FISUMP domain-containing protein [Flammeovirga sp. EKP202]|uniref:FISUMP domain-containing protein n=1 Tax=Flammeovirga sp. EKP202 TaxID=2770592 RepID=UPI00165F9864|nr:FISUMP domain-containing protein [Flammeovirga sp. EKP202]MBD0403946.1 hypothetical protein [Flammeovirga sp. EKP202]